MLDPIRSVGSDRSLVVLLKFDTRQGSCEDPAPLYLKDVSNRLTRAALRGQTLVNTRIGGYRGKCTWGKPGVNVAPRFIHSSRLLA